MASTVLRRCVMLQHFGHQTHWLVVHERSSGPEILLPRSVLHHVSQGLGETHRVSRQLDLLTIELAEDCDRCSSSSLISHSLPSLGWAWGVILSMIDGGGSNYRLQ